MPSILLISNNEVCYNARMLKAADYFYANGWDVTVFNGVTGIAPQEVYETIKKRPWEIIENDISKRSIKSKLKWLLNGVLHKVIVVFNDKLRILKWNKYYLNKALILGPKLKKDYDFILIHLVDNLPFAAGLKKEMNAKLIYDSQEYFVGQYSAFEVDKFRWVERNERTFIESVDIILATTNVMLSQIISDYKLDIPSFRVRNAPLRNSFERKVNSSSEIGRGESSLRLVWHGMGLFFNNRRGLHILLKAIANCRENVHLYLQGNLIEEQREIFERYVIKLDIVERVTIIPPAMPDDIVRSLECFDVGLTAELPEEMNQELTSSNKLFDYIHAGLAIISSDVAGLSETIDEFVVGLKYPPGDVQSLSRSIDKLARDEEQLNEFKQNSKKARDKVNWECDYEPVLEKMESLMK